MAHMQQRRAVHSRTTRTVCMFCVVDSIQTMWLQYPTPTFEPFVEHGISQLLSRTWLPSSRCMERLLPTQRPPDARSQAKNDFCQVFKQVDVFKKKSTLIMYKICLKKIDLGKKLRKKRLTCWEKKRLTWVPVPHKNRSWSFWVIWVTEFPYNTA